MADSEINPVYTPPHKGGGMFGSVVGGISGALLAAAAAGAAYYTGGSSLALIPAAAGAGGAIGGEVGNLVGESEDPSKSDSMTQDVPKSQEPKSTLGSLGNLPEVQMASMQDAKNELSMSNVPNAQDYMNQIDQAHQLLKQRLGTNSSMGMNNY